MVYCIWVIVGCLAFAFKNNKYVTALVSSFIAILFLFNTANVDLQNYYVQYIGLKQYATEPLFCFLNNLFFEMEIGFGVFRGFMACIVLFFVIWPICKLTPYPALALFMYSIFPLSLDITQIRYTVAYTSAFFGFYCLILYQHTRKKRYVSFFCLLILFATGFHYSALLFGILGFVIFNVKKHRFLFLVFIPFILVLGILMIDKLAPIIADVIGLHKTELWITRDKDSSILRTLRILISRGFPFLFSIFLAFLVKNKNYILVNGNTESIGFFSSDIKAFYNSELDPYQFYCTNDNRCMFVAMFYIWMFSFLEITIAGDYERLSRLGLLIGSVLITRQLYYLEHRNRQIASFLYLCVVVLCFAFVMFFMASKGGEIYYFNYVFRQVMENNSVF